MRQELRLQGRDVAFAVGHCLTVKQGFKTADEFQEAYKKKDLHLTEAAAYCASSLHHQTVEGNWTEVFRTLEAWKAAHGASMASGDWDRFGDNWWSVVGETGLTGSSRSPPIGIEPNSWAAFMCEYVQLIAHFLVCEPGHSADSQLSPVLTLDVRLLVLECEPGQPSRLRPPKPPSGPAALGPGRAEPAGVVRGAAKGQLRAGKR
jgi:hypothetical protein